MLHMRMVEPRITGLSHFDRLSSPISVRPHHLLGERVIERHLHWRRIDLRTSGDENYPPSKGSDGDGLCVTKASPLVRLWAAGRANDSATIRPSPENPSENHDLVVLPPTPHVGSAAGGALTPP